MSENHEEQSVPAIVPYHWMGEPPSVALCTERWDGVIVEMVECGRSTMEDTKAIFGPALSDWKGISHAAVFYSVENAIPVLYQLPTTAIRQGDSLTLNFSKKVTE